MTKDFSSSLKILFCFSALIILFSINGCKENTVEPVNDGGEQDILSGGDLTVFASGGTAFSFPAPNLSSASLEKHLLGDTQFEQNFVKAPATVNSGLGPLFNNNSCESCHSNDGRGRPPFTGEKLQSMLFRISEQGFDEHGGPNSVPGFGTQLQTSSIFGYTPEGSVNISYVETEGTYPDGTKYSLRKPVYNVSGNVPAGVLLSPRVAPPVFGIGLLESILEEQILSNKNNVNQDGVSGKANYVWNNITKQMELGRFGWKANVSTAEEQVALAYNQDMGVTSPAIPLENCYTSSNCDTTNDDPEISEQILEDVIFYVQTLAVPARRNYDNTDVKLGKKLFSQIGCNSCHVTEFKTGTNKMIPELSNQDIHPYTDLLLHDMGDGLADGRPDYDASGSEWRTAPLWGIGLVDIVNGYSLLLHDGRARSLEEAILWHGGEAKISQEKFMKLSPSDRNALIEFLKSL